MAGEFPIVFALYPRVTQLDFTAPLEVLARLPGAAIVLVAVRGGASCCRCSGPSRTRGAWCAMGTCSRAAE